MTSLPQTGRRIGVFGGAFDPPHQGHFALAKTAIEQLQLDELRIIPTGQAWHKARTLTSAEHRLAMARLAFADLPRAVLDPREMQRAGASYTADTLQELCAEFPGARMFLILGQDQAQALSTWHRWEEIPQLAIICVATRAGFTGDSVHLDNLPGPLPEFFPLEMPSVPLSATDIRRSVANHQNVTPLVIEPVARYIEQHHLYQTL